MSDYRTVTFPEQSKPEVVETLEIEGKRIAIVRYAAMVTPPATVDDQPTFGHADTFAAVDADATFKPLWASFYVSGNAFHQAGERSSYVTVAKMDGQEYAQRATVKATINAAADRIKRDRMWAQYAPVAEANIATHTREQFDALDADAEIEVGDMVVVYSHQRFRTGVAIKVTKTKVDCVAATPSTGVANGATRTKGKLVRLLRKGTPAAPAAPAVEETTPAPADDAAAAECARYDHGTFVSGCPAHPDTQWPGQIAAVSVEEVAPAASVSDGCPNPWHETAPARRNQVCPECPSQAPATAATAAVPAAGAAPAGAGEHVQGELLAAPTLDAIRLLTQVAAAPAGTTAVVDGAGQVDYVRTEEDLEGWGEAPEDGPESRDCVRVYVQSTPTGREQWCATHRAFEPIEDQDGAPATPALDEDEDRRAAAGRLFARTEGMTDAAGECTLYRMVRARVGARQLRIHDVAGELLGAVHESADGWQAETPAGVAIPMFMSAVPGGGWLGRFADAVDAVRAAAANQDGDQAATVAAQEGDDMAEASPTDGFRRLIAQCRDPRLVEVRPDLRQYATLADMDAALAKPADPAAELLALVVERGIDPATLRAVADRVERDQAGHVTEMEVNSVRVFSWGCRSCRAEGTGYEVGEDAYQRAAAHGPLAADSLFVRTPVIRHQGRGDNEHGVPRRTLARSLRFDGHEGEWVLEGHASTHEVSEEDIAGAQAWAAAALERGLDHDGGDAGRVTVARWEHHQDEYGKWWEPVTR